MLNKLKILRLHTGKYFFQKNHCLFLTIFVYFKLFFCFIVTLKFCPLSFSLNLIIMDYLLRGVGLFLFLWLPLCHDNLYWFEQTLKKLIKFPNRVNHEYAPFGFVYHAFKYSAVLFTWLHLIMHFLFNAGFARQVQLIQVRLGAVSQRSQPSTLWTVFVNARLPIHRCSLGK